MAERRTKLHFPGTLGRSKLLANPKVLVSTLRAGWVFCRSALDYVKMSEHRECPFRGVLKQICKKINFSKGNHYPHVRSVFARAKTPRTALPMRQNPEHL